ncbi:MAG: endonuclease/exonuclease/phosphatase family protein [Bacteroidia bacterium]
MKQVLVLFLISIFSMAKAQDTATVMFYNLLQFPNEKPNRISYLKTIVKEIKPDVFMVCELSNNTGSVTILTQALNTDGVNYYQRATFWENGYLNNMFYYNTRKFKLMAQDTISGSPRWATVYKLLHKNSAANGDSIISTYIVTHLKAGNSDEDARLKQAKKIRFYIDNKTDGKNVFLAGDFNIYSPTEGAFKAFTENGKHKLSDPVNEIGEWSNTAYYAPLHTQSTRTISFGGGSTGGLDDRFDWILTTNDVLNGQNKMEYLLGSYKAFGNDGKHFNQSINFKENTAVSEQIVEALHEMSDHLPVVMKVAFDYTNTINEKAKNLPEFSVVNKSLEIRNANEIQQVQIINLQGKILKSVSNLNGDNLLRISDLQNNQVLLVNCIAKGESFVFKLVL